MDKTTRLSNTFALDVLANMKSALVVVDKVGKVLVINESAGRILGVDDVAQTVGLDCREVFERIPYLSELLLSSGDFKTLPDRAELEIRDSSDSGRRVIGYSLSPVHNEQKERLGTALFFKDLTDVEREETKERIRDRPILPAGNTPRTSSPRLKD
jgi:PAS domain-containing protein